jgi:hypothetical protein
MDTGFNTMPACPGESRDAKDHKLSAVLTPLRPQRILSVTPR